MNFKILTTALMLTLAVPAAAQFTTIELAHEVALSELRLPSHESGTISFKACVECNYQTVRVSPGTRYVVNGRAVKLDDFRRATARIVERSTQAITVTHHLENNVVTAVELYR